MLHCNLNSKVLCDSEKKCISDFMSKLNGEFKPKYDKGLYRKFGKDFKSK
jgi:hypothetical protein